MRDQQMPDHRLKRFRVRRHGRSVHGRDNHARVGDPRRKPAIAADDAENRGANRSRVLERVHQSVADVPFTAAAPNGKHEHAIVCAEAAFSQPGGEHRVPPFVVRASRQLGHVIGRRVRFEPRELAEIIDRVRRVAGTPAQAHEEQAAAPRANRDQCRRHPFDGVDVDGGRDPRGFFEVSAHELNAHRPGASAAMVRRCFSVRTTSMAFLRRKALLSPCSRSIRSIGTSMKVRVRRSAFTSTSA